MGKLITALQDLEQEMSYIISLADKCYVSDSQIHDKVYSMFVSLRSLF